MTNKDKILHGTVKYTVLDISASLWTVLWGNPTLDVSIQKTLILQRQIRGYKLVEPPTKNQKAIPAKLVFHIDRKHHFHLSTAIGQLVAGDFYFVVRSCEYYMTSKGEMKQTQILFK